MPNYLFIDTESAWDEHLHDAYRSIDRKADYSTDPKDHKPRIPTKRIFAAAAFDVTLHKDGKVSCNDIASWTEYDHGDEQAIVANLFDHIRARPDHRVITYGGLANDVPLLVLSAMEYGMTLPQQLCSDQPRCYGLDRPHSDLGLVMKGAGREWAHLSEICLRMKMPAALFTGKTKVEYPSSKEGWMAVADHVRFDTLITAMATLAWIRIQGQEGLDIQAMIACLASFYIQNGHPNAERAALLHDLYRQIFERIGIEQGFVRAAA